MKDTEEKIWADEAAKKLGFFYYADSRGGIPVQETRPSWLSASNESVRH